MRVLVNLSAMRDLKMISKSKKKCFSPFGCFLLASIGFVCVLFIADDASAWGVPGRAAPGSGQGPGGGARSGSAPAPFGALFLSLGISIASVWYGKIKSQINPRLIVLCTVVIACCSGDVSPYLCFLISIPLLVCQIRSRCVQTRPHARLAWLCFLSALALCHIWASFVTPILLGVMVLFQLYISRLSFAAKSLLSISVLLALSTLQPVAGHVDLFLQEHMTFLTTSLLGVIGYDVAQIGHTITGLQTTIHITKVCVGTEIFATSYGLCAFLSVLFIDSKKQVFICMRLLTIISSLNLIRLITISILGHHFYNYSFEQMHFYLGFLIAALSYIAMGILILRYRAAQKLCSLRGAV